MNESDTSEFEAVAVVGMAGRFPGAGSVEDFWRNQLAAVDGISFLSAEELAAAGVPAEVAARPDYVPARGVLDGPELFDADLFGFSPREAEIMDPQIRVFLECAWQACEDAGYDIRNYGGRAGIYAGCGMSSYLLSNLMTRPDLEATVGMLQSRLGNSQDFLTTWTAYKLNLQGPCVTVQTACSTSLTAVHFAFQGLLDGECDLALAGGVSIQFPQRTGYLFQEGGVVSPDGRCRAFDAEAKGAVPGSGAGVVVLRRLRDALADGDTIHAVIRAVAVNNDGAVRAGFTAPGVEGQLKVVAEALSLSGVPAETVGYIEAHGSGTPLGDPIEVEALTRAFRHFTAERGFCALGSVKTSVGHLDAAAGVTGLIRAVCAVRDGKLPPSLHFATPNPKIDFAASPFYVSRAAADWPSRPGVPRRAGVSSLGIGGTNVHTVLEEPPAPRPGSPSRPWQQLLLSARSPEALETARANLAAHLRSGHLSDRGAEDDLADVAFTLKVGRHPFRHRLAVLFRDRGDALEVLEGGAPQRLLRGGTGAPQGKAGFALLLPGVGDHFPGMGAELYRGEPAFREAVDRCAGLLAPRLGTDIRQELWPAGTAATDGAASLAPEEIRTDLRRLLAPEPEDEASRRLQETWLAQPAVFVVEYALAQLLAEWGLRPQALLGYSVGELTAACLAGVFSLEDALELVAERALLIHQLPAGALLAVPLPLAETRRRLAETGNAELALSAANGPALSVVGGPEPAVAAFAARLEAEGVACRRVRTTHAFHTPMMEPARVALTHCAARLARRAPEIPFLSNVTGTWIRDDEATDPAYWGRHLVSTVRFAEGLEQLLSRGDLALFETGPGQTLASLARQHEACGRDALVVSALADSRDGRSELASLLTATGRLWLAGVPADWQGFYRHEERRRVPLPTYPFERRRFWIEPGTGTPVSSDSMGPFGPNGGQRTGKSSDVAEWLQVQGWRRGEPRHWPDEAEAGDAGPWLVFLDGEGLGLALCEQLELAGHRVERVVAGTELVLPSMPGAPYAIDPGRREDYSALLQALERQGALPRRIVHLWNVTPETAWEPRSLAAASDGLAMLSYHGLLFVAQALGERRLEGTVEIDVVSNQVQEVTGTEPLCPPKALLLGACQVISQEIPMLRCRSIDVELGRPADRASLATRLAAELAAGFMPGSGETVVALRGRHRWLRTLEHLRMQPAPAPACLRQGGVYLITAGAGADGLALARYLAEAAAARLALVVPPGTGADPAASPPLAELRRLAADLLLIEADAGEPAALVAAVEEARRRFGGLDGVVHNAVRPAAGLVQFKTPGGSAPVLAPKVAGTLALAAALEESGADFLVLFSGTTALLGGVGQVDAAAANSFVDAFARSRAGAPGPWTVAMGWDTFRWALSDPAQTAGLSRDFLHQLEVGLEAFGIEAGELVEAFRRVLALRLPQVYVSGRPLAEVLVGQDELHGGGLLEMASGQPAEHHPRPELATPYRPPGTPTEEALLDLWRDAFGFDLGVDDSFFELEGSSLLAIQLLTRMRSTFRVDLPIGALFEHPTVAQLAARVDELGGAVPKAEELAELDALLAEIENLSNEDAEQLLEMERRALG